MTRCPLYKSKYNYLCGNGHDCSGEITCPHYKKNEKVFDEYMNLLAREGLKNFYNKIVGLPPE